MRNHVIICATRPRGSEASTSNYQVYLFFLNHTPFVPSLTIERRSKLLTAKVLSTFCTGMMLLM